MFEVVIQYLRLTFSDPGFGEARTITFSSTAPSRLTSPTMEQQSPGCKNPNKILKESSDLIRKLFAALLIWSSGEMVIN